MTKKEGATQPSKSILKTETKKKKKNPKNPKNPNPKKKLLPNLIPKFKI